MLKDFFKNIFQKHFLKRYKGITIIEILVVISIVSIITAITLPQFSQFREQQNLTNSAQDVLDLINKARSQTLSSLSGFQYGVHFDSNTNQATLFQGMTYTSGASGNEVKTLISPVSIVGGPTDIVFARLTGIPILTGTGSISIQTTTFAKSITVGDLGQISMVSSVPVTVNTLYVTTANGSVTGPGSINCPSACSANFVSTDSISLTATNPNSGYQFSSWSGGSCNGVTSSTCNFTMGSGSQNITANFSGIVYTLDLTVTGSGSVTPTGYSVCNSNSTCNYNFNYNAIPPMVTLTAIPTAGNKFSGWTSGVCMGSNPDPGSVSGTCVVTMDQSKSTTATFLPSTYPTIVNQGFGTNAVATTSPIVNFPSGNDQDLLIVFFAVNSTPTVTWPVDWNVTSGFNASADKLEIGYKTISGTGSGSFGLTLSVAQRSAYQAVRVKDYWGLSRVLISSVATGGANVRPDSLSLSNSSWSGTKKTLWFSVAGRNSGSSLTTTSPTNYSTPAINTSVSASPANNGTTLVSANRQFETTSPSYSEDPSFFTTNNSNLWAAFTVAIQGLGL